jgi:HlyD family secretion protein
MVARRCKSASGWVRARRSPKSYNRRSSRPRSRSPAVIDTRNGLIKGVVTRVDPAVLNGTVTVDVKLEGALPRGARPDLSVDGTIELELLEDVLYVGRPVNGQPDATIGLFKVNADGEAERVSVKLGRSSVSSIEVIEGLATGDVVVLSDMSQWDEFSRIKLR